MFAKLRDNDQNTYFFVNAYKSLVRGVSEVFGHTAKYTGRCILIMVISGTLEKEQGASYNYFSNPIFAR